MTIQVDTKATSLSSYNWLRKIGATRDAILVFAGILYILGYLVWCINAYQNKLGFLPALDAQYFIAGIIPTFLVYLVYRVFVISIQIVETFRERLYAESNPYSNPSKLKLFIRHGLTISYYLSFILIPVLGQKGFPITAYIFAVLGLFVHDTFAYQLDAYKSGGFFRQAQIGTYLIFLGVLAFFFYYTYLYRNLPQELGGVRPSCAILDLERTQISDETFNLVAPNGTPQPNQPVIQSRKVEILYTNHEVTIIRSQEKVIELSKDAIQAMISCD